MPTVPRFPTPTAACSLGQCGRGQAMARYLVTGGAGYVGSHMVDMLHAGGADVTVLDSLRQGHPESLPPGVRLVVADVADVGVVDAVLSDGTWDAVFHFAAMSLVGESMASPMSYFVANAGGGFALVDSCIRHGIDRFVLSSTANLFGKPDVVPITEDADVDPGSPYGESKLMLETALRWAGKAHGLRSACLRYFNAAGADPSGRLGEDHDPETHLIPLAIDAALGRGGPLTVFGTDHPTPDGTCVRDYVHVTDLCDAHVRALAMLGRGSVTYNVGNGIGHSVLDVISSVERVIGKSVPVEFGSARPGDPAALVAASGLLRTETGMVARPVRHRRHGAFGLAMEGGASPGIRRGMSPSPRTRIRVTL